VTRAVQLFLIVVCAVGASERTAHAISVRVRATPTFQTIRSQPAPAGANLTGTLHDETRTALPNQTVTLRASTGPAKDCTTGRASAVTDDNGRFCFLLEAPLDDRVELDFVGSAYLQAARREVVVELSPSPIELEVELQGAAWDVEGLPQAVRVQRLGDGLAEDVHPVRLLLERADGALNVIAGPKPLSTHQAAEFSVEPKRFGKPGPAQLVAVLGDDQDAPLGRRAVPLVISSHAELRWRNPPRELRPELGFEIELSVTSQGEPVTVGWVETHVGEKSVGTSKVTAGGAVIASRFLAGGRESILLRARYLPEQPWLKPGNELELELPLKLVPLWVHLPWLVVGALSALWIFRAWWRPARRAPREALAKAINPTPGVSVVESGAPETGWRGVVRDIHTGEVVAGARIWIELPSLTGRAIALEGRSEQTGTFHLGAANGLTEGARWVVEAADHTRLMLPVPPPGRIDISLSSRRRSLLQHLVRWASERGFGTSEDPTPRAVSELARWREQSTTERWALEVEQAVYGRAALDADRENALVAGAPARDPSPPKSAKPLNR
jgi:hypothetical protein